MPLRKIDIRCYEFWIFFLPILHTYHKSLEYSFLVAESFWMNKLCMREMKCMAWSLFELNVEANIYLPNWDQHVHPLWSTVLNHLGKCFPSTLLFFQSFTKDLRWYWKGSDISIADVLVLQWNIPHENIQLFVSHLFDCWDQCWNPQWWVHT